MYQNRKVVLPVLLVIRLQCTNHANKGLDGSLILVISFLMIKYCSHCVDVSSIAQFFDQLRLKVTSLVCYQLFGETIICNKFIPEGSHCISSGLIEGYYSVCISCEVVHVKVQVHLCKGTGYVVVQAG